MSDRRLRKNAASAQRGFALIAILALAALITAFLISSALNRSSADVSNDREQRNMDALRQAKAALIAYAAAVDWRLQVSCSPASSCYIQPGSLPCPDMDGDGDSDCTGATTASMIGRLPWQTLGIDHLRDATGEEIWYALSHNFRKLQCTSSPDSPPAPNGCTKINSDTQGQLSVTGAAAANNVVAVLIAPGIPLQGQSRPSNTAANYVESFAAGDGVHFSFTTNALPDQNINDRVLVITQPELMAAVEPVVAARIEKDIAPLVQAYYTKYNAYPFPAPFGDPSRQQAAYKGATSTATQGGLLPITIDPAWLSWKTGAPITVTQIAGGTGNGTSGPNTPAQCIYSTAGGGNIVTGNGCTLDSVDCSHSTSSAIVCEIKYVGTGTPGNDRPAISIQATVKNAALSFPLGVAPRLPTMTGDDDRPLLSDNVHTPANTNPNNTGQWSWSAPPETSVPFFFLPTSTYNAAPNSDGSSIITITGRLQNAGSIASGGTNGRVTMTIPPPSTYDTITNADWTASSPQSNETAWFIANEWFRQTYYAVSPGLLPAGGGTCNRGSAPFCLKVANLRPSYTVPDDKRAILVLAGRSLNGVNRPTTDPAAYFEGANLSTALGTTSFAYENRIGAPTSTNDRVIVVFP